VNEKSLDQAAAEGISIISRLPRTYNAVDAEWSAQRLDGSGVQLP
jgi:hypothetical protein